MPVVLPLHGKVLRLRGLDYPWDSRDQPAGGLGVHAGRMQSVGGKRYGGDARGSLERRPLVLKTTRAQEKCQVGPCQGSRVPRRVLASLGLTPHLYSRSHGLSSLPTYLSHCLSGVTGHMIQGFASGASLVPIHMPASCC